MGLTTPYVSTLNSTRVSLALKFLFGSSKNLQSTHEEFNIKVQNVTSNLNSVFRPTTGLSLHRFVETI